MYHTGWAYAGLSETGSSLALAEQILNEYVDETQGLFHSTPKTMSIVQSSGFNTFLAAWEALSLEMKSLLDANNDADFFAHLQRARGQSLAFETIDETGFRTPSALDIGSFLESLENLCTPVAGSVLKSALNAAQSTYDSMFVLRRNGPGTPDATGMHIFWPFRIRYAEDTELYDLILFNNTLVFATSDAPNFQAFLKTFYISTTPPNKGLVSVCGNAATSQVTPESEDDLLLKPEVVQFSASAVIVQSELAITTDFISTEYGLDLSHVLNDEPTRRRILAPGSTRPMEGSLEGLHTKLGRNKVELGLQEDDIFILWGGDIAGSFSGSTYTAEWSRTFFAISAAGDDQFEVVYVVDVGNGLKATPVIYFSPGTSSMMNSPTTLEEAEALGGQEGFLTFSIDPVSGVSSGNLALFLGDGATVSETPRSALGFVIPIVYVFLQDSDKSINTLLGGLYGTVLEWSETVELGITVFSDETFRENFGADQGIISMLAIDYSMYEAGDGTEGYDEAVFVIDYTSEGDTPPAETSEATTKQVIYLYTLSVALAIFL